MVAPRLELTADHPQTPYQRSSDKRSVHWGQLKLLSVELYFLSAFATDETTVLYVGAAPGNHIQVLAQMFPTVNWELYDPRPFNIRPTDRIRIHQELFTDPLASIWAQRPGRKLLISDIRGEYIRGGDDFDHSRNEATVARDQALQAGWFRTIRPDQALFKFRLPYVTPIELAKGATREYLDGRILLQPFAPVTSTETRLIPKPDGSTREYDIVQYESQLYHHNTRDRGVIQYDNPVGTRPTEPVASDVMLGNDYDSVMLARIVMVYLRRMNIPNSEMAMRTREYLRWIVRNLGDPLVKLRPRVFEPNDPDGED